MADPRVRDEARNRSTPELVTELARETSELVRKELELARAEMTKKGKEAGIGVGLFGGAGVAGLLALGSLTAFAVVVLALAVPGWLSALVVTLIWAAIAAVLGFRGRERVQEAVPPKPEQTIETVKEDVRMAKARARAGRT